VKALKRRVMKRLLTAALFGALVFAIALRAFAQVSDRELTVGSATALRLNVSGSIHVTPVAGLTTIKFHVVDSGPSTPPMTLNTSRSGSRMNVSITGPSQNILPFVGASGYELQLQYPARMHLDLRQTSGRIHVDNVPASMQLYDAEGDIVVDDSATQLTAYAAAGNISVTNAHTSLTLTADTGNVNATLAPAWRGSLIRLEASNGDLHLSVPAGFKAHYDVTSGSGHVSNPLRNAATGPLVFMLTEQGDVSIVTL
jgi:Putative adhesin